MAEVNGKGRQTHKGDSRCGDDDRNGAPPILDNPEKT